VTSEGGGVNVLLLGTSGELEVQQFEANGFLAVCFGQ
jgi:hypothetical protein